MIDPTIAASSPENEFIAFRLGRQDFCVEIRSVREIRGWTEETIIPHAPQYVRGAINLRGAVLPIVDLSDLLGMGPAIPTERHAIVVVQLEEQVIGLIVDAVSDILTLSDASIQPTPDIASDLAKRFIRGTASIESQLVSVMDLQNVLPVAQRQAA